MDAELSSEQLEKEMIRIGKTLVSNFFVLLKTAQNYEEGHSALNMPTTNLIKLIKDVQRRNEESSLRIHGGYLYLGELRLKPDSSCFDAFMFIMQELKRCYIGGINFTASVKSEDVIKLVYIIKDLEVVESSQAVFEKVLEQARKKMIMGIELESQSEDNAAPEGDVGDIRDAKVRSKKVYLQTVHAVTEVMENAKMGQTLRLRKSKRVVQGLIDQLLSKESNIVGLTTIRSHDEYTYNHSVNVCILSLAIGQRLGLSKARLCELGMAALFHDIGKADIPLEILNKPAEFTSDEWEIMKRHPIHGVRKLMKLKGLDALSARIITGAFEHHMNYNYSGYPQVPYRNLSILGRIISIADCYDGMTSSRVYSKVPLPNDKALKYMLDKKGTAYDPLLIKIFVNCIGVYPIGTLLLMNTKELAVVIKNNPDNAKWDAPVIKVIADALGNEIDGDLVDLSSPDMTMKIAATEDPATNNINISRYFM